MLRGVDVHEIGGVPLAVDRHRYLVLNEGRTFASYFAADDAVEVFCVFNDVFVAQALASRRLSDAELLDDPDTIGPSSVELVERLYPHDGIVTPGASLRSSVRLSTRGATVSPRRSTSALMRA